MKTVGIMQPYFLPYIGYFQLMNAVDEFVVYDTIEFTRKGWIHRNRMLQNAKDDYFTLPIKKDSDYLNINKRYLAAAFADDKNRMLRKIEANYRKAPEFNSFYPVVMEIFCCDQENLFDFIYNSLSVIKRYLGISTPLLKSSELPAYIGDLKAQEKVLEICEDRKASRYINAIGGQSLYNKADFAAKCIELKFIESNPVIYKQFSNEFVSWLSILDVLMFNSVEQTQKYLNEFKLI